MDNITVVTNKESGNSIEYVASQCGENFLSVSKQGQGWTLVTKGYSSNDFRKLADYLDKIRNGKGEI